MRTCMRGHMCRMRESPTNFYKCVAKQSICYQLRCGFQNIPDFSSHRASMPLAGPIPLSGTTSNIIRSRGI